MIQFWEDLEGSEANCLNCSNDSPFFIPIARTDFIPLRLNIPYVQVEDNGGGLPTTVTVSVMDVTGTVTSCTYGTQAANKFLLEYINDATERIAEYKLLLPNPFADEDADTYNTYTFPVNVGDKILLTVNGTIYHFRFGYDETPFPLINYKSGYLCLGLSATNYGFTTLYINGVLTALGTMTSSAPPTCAYDGGLCWRIKVTINFSTAVVINNYFTKPFKFVNCEDTIYVQGTYPTGTIDCTGMLHEQGGTTFYATKLYMRLHADLEQERSRTRLTMNSKCYVYKSERTKMARIKSDPMPQWYADAFEAIALSQIFMAEGVRYYLDEVESFLNDSDIPGSNFQNIDLPLQQCKCENVFVCQ